MLNNLFVTNDHVVIKLLSPCHTTLSHLPHDALALVPNTSCMAEQESRGLRAHWLRESAHGRLQSLSVEKRHFSQFPAVSRSCLDLCPDAHFPLLPSFHDSSCCVSGDVSAASFFSSSMHSYFYSFPWCKLYQILKLLKAKITWKLRLHTRVLNKCLRESLVSCNLDDKMYLINR